jgi:hypothetical protein
MYYLSPSIAVATALTLTVIIFTWILMAVFLLASLPIFSLCKNLSCFLACVLISLIFLPSFLIFLPLCVLQGYHNGMPKYRFDHIAQIPGLGYQEKLASPATYSTFQQ